MKPFTLGATIAATIALLGTQPAAAASTVPFGGFTAEDRPVVLQVTKNLRQIKLARTALDITCSDGSSDFAPDAWQKIVVSRTGGFSGTFADTPGTSFDGKPMVSSGKIVGKINKKRNTISGIWNLDSKITQADGSLVTCTSGDVKFNAAAKGTRKPVTQGFYGAFSSADYPLAFQVAKTGRTISSVRGTFELKCSKGGYRFVSDGWNRMPLSARGKFQASVDQVEEKFSDNTTYKVTSTISGTLAKSGSKLTGTWRVRWDIPEPDGTTDVCDSGTVRFTVKR